MDPRSQRWLKTSKSSFAPMGDRGTKPSSSMISGLSRDSCRCRLKGRQGDVHQAQGEGGRKDQPGIGHQAVVVEGDADAVGVVAW